MRGSALSTAIRLVLTIGLAAAPSASAAQTATLKGRVLNTNGEPIALAEVGVVDGRRIVASTTDGRYLVDGLAAGRTTIFARAIGHRWITATVVLAAGDTTEQTFRLESTVLTLPEVVVEARWAKPARLAHTTRYDDFYRRRKAGHGTFLTRDRIDAANALRSFELLRGVAGVKVSWNPPGVPGTEVRFPRCTDFPPKVGVWIDGNQLMYRAPPPRPQDFDSLGWRADAWGAWIELFDVVRPSEIEAIEVFRGLSQMPAEFRTHDSCAAVVIWTREGGRSQPEK